MKMHEKIKIFADGADLNSILNLYKDDRIKGFTTNPTLMRKAGISNYEAFAKEVLSHIKDKPISFEVFSDDLSEMVVQAKKIASWGDNVYVKIPITNTKGESTLKEIDYLAACKVKLNVTAVFTPNQAVGCVDMLKKHKTPSVISVFAGRIADTGVDPQPIMKHIKEYISCFSSPIELLWASPRELYNIVQAWESYCDIITVPHDLLAKLNLFDKNLDEYSLETVKMFYNDATKSGYTL